MDLAATGARRGTIGGVVGLVLGVVVLGPALAPGYTLHYDLVFVPDLDLSARTLGTDGSVPRAVPNDLLVALGSLLLPGWLVQKLLLLGAFVLGGVGAGRLAGTGVGAAAAATWWSWNPWVGERLGIGHWGYLLGFALLPWVLVAAARVRSTGAGVPALVATLTAAALGGSTPGVLATLLAVLVVLVPGAPGRPRAQHIGIVLGTALLANAAWWWPFLRASSRAADPGGAGAFSSAGDTPFGAVGSLLLGGGLWNDRTWFVERTTWPVAGAALVAVLLVLVLAMRRAEWWRDPVARGATLAGVVGLLVAVVGAVPGGQRLLESLITTVPGAGLLRDGQKFAALWVLLVAVALAAVVDRLRGQQVPAVLLVVALAWPVATLPTLAWGHGGTWGSAQWPKEVGSVAGRLADSGDPVAVFPWSTYRQYAWNGDRVVLDPWNRLLPQQVVSDDRLPLRGAEPVAGEDPVGAEVSQALAKGEDVTEVLRRHGVRWVLVQTDQPAPEGTVPDLPGDPAMTAGDLEVHDLGRSARSDPPPDAWRALGLGGTAAAVLLSAGLWWRGRRNET